MASTFLGLDLGTSGLRGLLIDVTGNAIGSAEAHYDVARPQSGWSEQNPSDWITACQEVATSLRQKFPSEWCNLAGVGVSGHMHGAVLIDNAGQVIRPCILWNDTRSHEEAAELDATAEARKLSGNIVFPGFTSPKLKWVAIHEPENFARVAKVFLPAAYLNFWLMGEAATDMSDAAGTAWLDVAQRGWSERLLELGGLSQDHMPRVVEGSDQAGSLCAKRLQEWGLESPVAVAGGAGDNAATACGAGLLSEGSGFVSLGTSGVLLAAKESFAPKPETAVHTFCHAVPGRWYQMGVILAATDCLNWFSTITGATPAELSNELGAELQGPSGLTFLPYLSGERTPHNDSHVRGSFVGLGVNTERRDMTQAILEGVCFALRDCLDALCETGTEFDQLLAFGGGTASPYWCKLLATILNVPLALPSGSEFGAALGAARLAICAATNADPSDVMTPPAIRGVVPPDASLRDAYTAAYSVYRKAYPAHKSIQT